MKHIKLAALLALGLSVFSCRVMAEAAFQSAADVQGSWKLEYTKKSATTDETLKREDTWTFNDGKVTITHIPREGIYYDQPPVNYEIDSGKLKIALLGRPDKFDIFSLVEKSAGSLTLKGKFGDIYHFVKK